MNKTFATLALFLALSEAVKKDGAENPIIRREAKMRGHNKTDDMESVNATKQITTALNEQLEDENEQLEAKNEQLEATNEQQEARANRKEKSSAAKHAVRATKHAVSKHNPALAVTLASDGDVQVPNAESQATQARIDTLTNDVHALTEQLEARDQVLKADDAQLSELEDKEKVDAKSLTGNASASASHVAIGGMVNLQIVTGADESLEANRVRKLYGSVRDALTWEAEKAFKHHTSAFKWNSAMIEILQPSNESTLLQGIKNMIGLSKMQTKIVGLFKTIVAGEKECIAVSNAMLSGPGADLLQTADTSQLAQYLARDADSMAQLAACEADASLGALGAVTEFLSDSDSLAQGALGVVSARAWLKGTILATEKEEGNFLDEAAQGMQKVRDESASLKEQLQGGAFLEQHVQQMQDIVEEYDTTDNRLLKSEANVCKKAEQFISLVPSDVMSETLSILRECITENEGAAHPRSP